jgi:hypothetical protein
VSEPDGPEERRAEQEAQFEADFERIFIIEQLADESNDEPKE